MTLLKFLAPVVLATIAHAYSPPIGIPNPSTVFGWEIDRATPSWPANWTAPTPSEAPGFYYIDNTHPNRTDSSNPYGYPGKPRATIPYIGNNTLSAGNFVYIHAGTYAPGTMSLAAQGTSASPIWFTGNPVTRPTLNSQLHVGDFAGAAYWVIENLNFNAPGSIDIRPTGTGSTVHHILVRNCTLTGSSSVNDPNGINNGGGSADANQTSDVCIYNCTISNYGKYLNNPVVDGIESEQACIYNDYRRTRTWILDCTLSTPGADCVAGSHNANDTNQLSQYLYIGRNTIVCGGENAIDHKSTRYIVISQNDISGHAFREQGWLVVVHSGGNPVPCRDVAVIFNTIHGGVSGVMGTSTNGTRDLIIVGNIFYDIRASYAPQADPALNGMAVGSFATQGTNYIAHNTAYDCDKGFAASNLSPSNTIQSHGNILANITGHCINVDNLVEPYFISDYNLFPTGATFFWLNGSRNFAFLQGTATVEAHSLAGSPAFTDAAAHNFTLLPTSPAIDSGTQGGAYAAFQATFGTSITVDATGRTRPVDGVWDIGALESALPPNAAPSNLLVVP
jgi:hypothetical protein